VAANVLLVDDATELLPVLRQSLRLNGGFNVVAEATDAAGAIAAARRYQPDIVVLDLGLPDLSGSAALTSIREAAPTAQIVIFSGAHSADREALAPRADAYVGKEQEIDGLLQQLIKIGEREHLSASLELSSEPSSISAARHFLDTLCAQWECGDILPEARIIVSELVTNAVLHAGTKCEVRVTLTSDDALRIEVTDHGHGELPVPQQPDPNALHGRGLLIVSVISSAWGIEAVRGNGNLVWSVLLPMG
jgi:DNA-binding NarL/FixJ family response regulator